MSQVQRLPREIEMSEQAGQWLAECDNIDEIKNFRDKVEALRLYFRKQKGCEAAEQSASKMKLRAERRIGEISRELEKSVGGRPGKTPPNVRGISKTETLASSGIAPRMANRCEAIAAVPAAEFESAIGTTAKLTSHAMQTMGRVEHPHSLRLLSVAGGSQHRHIARQTEERRLQVCCLSARKTPATVAVEEYLDQRKGSGK